MKVIKRDGHMVEYMPSKIEEAIDTSEEIIMHIKTKIARYL